MKLSSIFSRDAVFDRLDAIRAKPESTRWAIVIAITTVIGAALITGWLWNLGGHLGDLKENQASLLSPIQGIIKSFNAIRKGNASDLSQNQVSGDVGDTTPPPNPTSQNPVPSRWSRFSHAIGEVLQYNLALIGSSVSNLFH